MPKLGSSWSWSDLTLGMLLIMVGPYLKPGDWIDLIVLGVLTNLALKVIVMESRPTGRSAFGWPSGHAQLSGILVEKSMGVLPPLGKVFALALGVITSYLRVLEHHHTLNQVIWGFSLGLGLSYGMSLI